jgi:DNA mismatch repair protein MutS
MNSDSHNKPAAVLFRGILSEKAETYARGAPDFFVDLNLDQIVAAVVAGHEDYELNEFYYTPLAGIDAISYRHEIFQDLEHEPLFEQIKSFAEKMRSMREQLTRVAKLHYTQQRNAWFLHAIEFYCDAVARFNAELAKLTLKSRGLKAFRQYLSNYATSPVFISLVEDMNAIKAALSAVKYCVLIKGDTFTVRNDEGEIDYSKDVERTFEKFKQGAAKDYLVKYKVSSDINHIEAQIQDFVALLNPEVFSRLADYCARHKDFIDRAVAGFDREIHFYVCYLDYIAPLKRSGLRFCYPEISADSKDIYDQDGFDLALAKKLADSQAAVVCNDFHLTGPERIIVVSGPNQGGKSTFARAFGQLHYLASIGCPVPGSEARLFLFDRIFTQFEKEEKVENLRGKLQDDLIRVHTILKRTTPRSIVILNEIFTSTTLQDEAFLSRKVMDRLIARDLLAVWVTFVDDLSRIGEQTVSMASMVVPENPAQRTFKVVRRPADGLAYAMAIAEKYRLTYERIKGRLGS